MAPVLAYYQCTSWPRYVLGALAGGRLVVVVVDLMHALPLARLAIIEQVAPLFQVQSNSNACFMAFSCKVYSVTEGRQQHRPLNHKEKIVLDCGEAKNTWMVMDACVYIEGRARGVRRGVYCYLS